MTPEKASKHTITGECFVTFSNNTAEQDDYHGMATDLFTSAYKFSRKEKPKATFTVYCATGTKDAKLIHEMVIAKNRAK